MCKLAIIVKEEGENKPARLLMIAQQEDLEMEKDGAAGLAIDKNGEIEVCRRFLEYGDVFRFVQDKIDKSVLVALHTRSRTSGEKNIKNTHFFSKKNEDKIFFAHNGFIGAYNSPSVNGHFPNHAWTPFKQSYKAVFEDNEEDNIQYGEETGEKKIGRYTEIILSCPNCQKNQRGYCKRHKNIGLWLTTYTNPETEHKPQTHLSTTMCDSWQFLQDIPDNFSLKEITELSEKKHFMGMGILVTKGKALLLTKKDAHVITDKKTYAGFFSYQPEINLETTLWDTIAGVPYIHKQEGFECEDEVKTLVQGYHEILLPLKGRKIKEK